MSKHPSFPKGQLSEGRFRNQGTIQGLAWLHAMVRGLQVKFGFRLVFFEVRLSLAKHPKPFLLFPKLIIPVACLPALLTLLRCQQPARGKLHSQNGLYLQECSGKSPGGASEGLGAREVSGGSMGLSVVGTKRSSCRPFLTPGTFPLCTESFSPPPWPPQALQGPPAQGPVLVIWDLLDKIPSYLHMLQRSPTDTAVLKCSPALNGDYRAFPWKNSLGNPPTIDLGLSHPKIFTEALFPFSLMFSRACCMKNRQSEQI